MRSTAPTSTIVLRETFGLLALLAPFALAEDEQAPASEPVARADKRSETRKRVEQETAEWVARIQEEDRKRREARDLR